MQPRSSCFRATRWGATLLVPLAVALAACAQAQPSPTPTGAPPPSPTATPTLVPIPPVTPTSTSAPTPTLVPSPSPLPSPTATVTGGFLATPTPIPPGLTGVVTGFVEIGPLCPVEPCPTPAANPYVSRSLVLTPSAGSPIQVRLRDDGTFRAVVPAGQYQVTLTDCTFLGCPRALPQAVTAAPGRETVVEIRIDTGIR